MMMHRVIICSGLAVFLVLSLTQHTSADTIELKDGKKLECVIVMKAPERYAIRTWEPSLCKIKTMSIETESVASVKKASPFDNDSLIALWNKKIWDSCPEVKKQEELRKIRAEENRERRATEQRKKEKELERASRKEEREANELQAAVSYSGNDIAITNLNNFDWTDVKLDLNSGLIFSGYIYKPNFIGAGTTRTISFSKFSKKDGTRFNVSTTKPMNLDISCNTEYGRQYAYPTFP